MQKITGDTKQKARQQQAQALLRVINNPAVNEMTGQNISVSQEIQSLLQKGDLKAIQTTQEILRAANIAPQVQENVSPKKIEGLIGKISTVATDNGKVHGFR